jgi:hypothetical protein
MSTDNPASLRIQTQLSVLTAVIGVALMIYMIVVESEPGALPLFLIVLGAGWFFLTRRRMRSRD